MRRLARGGAGPDRPPPGQVGLRAAARGRGGGTRRAAPYATDLLRGGEPREIRKRLLAIPLPGHTRGSVAYLLEDSYLFTGDSLAWSRERKDLQAFRDACWYSWSEQKKSLAKLAAHRFEWVLAGHGGSVRLPPEEMRSRLVALVERM